jgi:hypothetical protein
MMRTLGLAAVLAALVAALGAAAGAGSDERVVVTRDTVSLPAGCTPRGLATFVDGFLEAFNRGDWNHVETHIAAAGGSGPPAFQFVAWRQDSVRERESVTSFLAAIRDRGERFRLLSVRVGKVRNVSSSVELAYRLERPGGLVLGKGLIDCARQRIWQWAMAPVGGPPTCPVPVGWSASGPIVACTSGPNASPLAPGFSVTSTLLALPRRCTPNAVRRRVTAALSAFNLGAGEDFAKQFVRRGQFHPYTASIRGSGFVGDSRIARFVRARYAAGDGWTATSLRPPQGTAGLPSRAIYGLEFTVSHQGAPFADRSGSKLVVDCSSGLLKGWVGPASKLPTAG